MVIEITRIRLNNGYLHNGYLYFYIQSQHDLSSPHGMLAPVVMIQ